MNEYTTLLGADDVLKASHNMRSAANDMQRAADNLDSTLERHRRAMEDWLQKFEAILTEEKT